MIVCGGSDHGGGGRTCKRLLCAHPAPRARIGRGRPRPLLDELRVCTDNILLHQAILHEISSIYRHNLDHKLESRLPLVGAAMTSCLVSRVRHSELATLIRNGWCASMLLIRSQSNDVRPVIHSPSTSPPPVPPPAPKPCRTNVTWDVMAGRGLKPKEQPKATRDVQSLQAALLESALGHVVRRRR